MAKNRTVSRSFRLLARAVICKARRFSRVLQQFPGYRRSLETLSSEHWSQCARDNVVFEAGYFIGLKGKRNVLIVREKGSKMPADLGGDIYALLPDKVDIGPIERIVSGFMAAL
jgi:hypothetical protein